MAVTDDIRRALYDAIDWQTGLADAYGAAAPEGKQALEQAEKYRKILRRRYKSDGRTPMETLGDGAKSVSIYEIAKR